MLYGLNDYTIIPAVVSNIKSRKECDTYTKERTLPLFAAPMSSVIDDNNYTKFNNAGINAVIPRNVDIDKRLNLCFKTFVAMSLDEFESYFVYGYRAYDEVRYICVDIANGHMKRLVDACCAAKKIAGNKLVLMAGNIANPETYLEYAKAGVDYVRVGIGSGNVCTTSANTGIHYPIGSLLQAINNEAKIALQHFDKIPKIVADGGFKNFDQIIKALALGADYVMLGEIFAKAKEACSGTWWEGNVEYRRYYGMSTKIAQQELGNITKKTAEGIKKHVSIDYTLAQWVDNFKHYLMSAMSYTNSRTLDEFKRCNIELMSPQSFNSYYK
jgi:IMP dehydrogenase/GMP reductase